MLFMGAIGQGWYGVRQLVFTHPFRNRPGAERSILWSRQREVGPAWAIRVRLKGADHWSVCRPC